MAPDEDRHRDKRFKTAEEIGGSFTPSATTSNSRPNVQPVPPPMPHDRLSTSSHVDSIHPSAAQDPLSRRRANGVLNHDAVDDSDSKGKDEAPPLHDRSRVLETIEEDVGDAITSPSADHEHGDDDSGGSEYNNREDSEIAYSASSGKGRTRSPSRGSNTEVSHGAENRSHGEAQDDDMENHGDEHLYHEDEDGGEDDRDDSSGTDTVPSIGGYGMSVQVPWAEPVDPPVQEFRLREDGTWDIRSEGK